MPVLKYHTGSGVYADLPGNIEEVTISANQPPVNTDLWIDTDDDTGYIPSQRLGSRNVIRNGDMSIAQRGNGNWAPGDWTTTYGVDGWRGLKVGGTVNYGRYVPPAGTGSPLLMVSTSGQSTAGQFTNLEHLIEDVSLFSDKVMTLSFDAVSGGGTPKIGIEYQQSFGTGGSTGVAFPIQAVPITPTRTRYSITFRTASLAGKTIGSGSYFSLTFWLSAGSDYAARASSIGIQNSTISISDVQLEDGNVASPFERLPVQQQLAWCQRYFQRIGHNNPNVIGSTWLTYGYGLANSTTRATVNLVAPVPFRAAPTMTGTAPNTFKFHDGASTATTPTAIITDIASSLSQSIWVDCSGGLVVGQALKLINNGAVGASTIDLSAEL